jgi:hypothetical protein
VKILLLSFVIVAGLAGCASAPNYQLNCESQGGPLFKCEPCPFYISCSRLK